MKKFTFLFLFILVGCSPKEVNYFNIVERKNIAYEINSETPFSGIAIDLHLNGQLMEKRSYRKGLLDGSYELYYSNGQLAESGTYANGQLNGLYKTYTIEGRVLEISEHPNGPSEEYYYYDTGELEERRIFKDKTVTYEYYSMDGKDDAKEIWYDGFENGLHEIYEGGKIIIRNNLKDGVLDGPYEYYFANGQLSAKGVYTNDKDNGPYEKYFKNGQLEEIGTYKYDEKIGLFKRYSENGNLIEELTFIDEYDPSTITTKSLKTKGESVYAINCVACHQTNGQGISGIFPALAGSDIVLNDKEKNIEILMEGVQVAAMNSFDYLSEVELASVITYVSNSWGNDGYVVTPKEIRGYKDIKYKVTYE